ncbi:hypothetical protein O9G_005161 [Rozella allomycis CSF55]|uniref:Uncharacterized protein n=1 Tax=Rozella allomycis (strain CSF55) TaxID=988480 RepID=A0A075AX57_ROZAC|nr:hypothetical protein O9G_005161 [Rozella allomycis CSF55]|eukprot:EPZ33089.1 hypothetical protein O9G_005161 [Rozella allomycis CSF55]
MTEKNQSHTIEKVCGKKYTEIDSNDPSVWNLASQYSKRFKNLEHFYGSSMRGCAISSVLNEDLVFYKDWILLGQEVVNGILYNTLSSPMFFWVGNIVKDNVKFPVSILEFSENESYFRIEIMKSMLECFDLFFDWAPKYFFPQDVNDLLSHLVINEVEGILRTKSDGSALGYLRLNSDEVTAFKIRANDFLTLLISNFRVSISYDFDRRSFGFQIKGILCKGEARWKLGLTHGQDHLAWNESEFMLTMEPVNQSLNLFKVIGWFLPQRLLREFESKLKGVLPKATFSSISIRILSSLTSGGNFLDFKKMKLVISIAEARISLSPLMVLKPANLILELYRECDTCKRTWHASLIGRIDGAKDKDEFKGEAWVFELIEEWNVASHANNIKGVEFNGSKYDFRVQLNGILAWDPAKKAISYREVYFSLNTGPRSIMKVFEWNVSNLEFRFFCSKKKNYIEGNVKGEWNGIGHQFTFSKARINDTTVDYSIFFNEDLQPIRALQGIFPLIQDDVTYFPKFITEAISSIFVNGAIVRLVNNKVALCDVSLGAFTKPLTFDFGESRISVQNLKLNLTYNAVEKEKWGFAGSAEGRFGGVGGSTNLWYQRGLLYLKMQLNSGNDFELEALQYDRSVLSFQMPKVSANLKFNFTTKSVEYFSFQGETNVTLNMFEKQYEWQMPLEIEHRSGSDAKRSFKLGPIKAVKLANVDAFVEIGCKHGDSDTDGTYVEAKVMNVHLLKFVAELTGKPTVTLDDYNEELWIERAVIGIYIYKEGAILSIQSDMRVQKGSIRAVFIGQVDKENSVQLAIAGRVQNVDPFKLLHIGGFGREMNIFQLNIHNLIIYASNANIVVSKVHELMLKDRYVLIQDNEVIKQGVGMRANVTIPGESFFNKVLDIFLGGTGEARNLAFHGFGNKDEIELALDIKNEDKDKRELENFNGIAIRKVNAFFRYYKSDLAIGMGINLIFTIKNEEFDYGDFILEGTKDIKSYIDLDLNGAIEKRSAALSFLVSVSVNGEWKRTLGIERLTTKDLKFEVGITTGPPFTLEFLIQLEAKYGTARYNFGGRGLVVRRADMSLVDLSLHGISLKNFVGALLDDCIADSVPDLLNNLFRLDHFSFIFSTKEIKLGKKVYKQGYSIKTKLTLLGVTTSAVFDFDTERLYSKIEVGPINIFGLEILRFKNSDLGPTFEIDISRKARKFPTLDFQGYGNLGFVSAEVKVALNKDHFLLSCQGNLFNLLYSQFKIEAGPDLIHFSTLLDSNKDGVNKSAKEELKSKQRNLDNTEKRAKQFKDDLNKRKKSNVKFEIESINEFIKRYNTVVGILNKGNSATDDAAKQKHLEQAEKIAREMKSIAEKSQMSSDHSNANSNRNRHGDVNRDVSVHESRNREDCDLNVERNVERNVEEINNNEEINGERNVLSSVARNVLGSVLSRFVRNDQRNDQGNDQRNDQGNDQRNEQRNDQRNEQRNGQRNDQRNDQRNEQRNDQRNDQRNEQRNDQRNDQRNADIDIRNEQRNEQGNVNIVVRFLYRIFSEFFSLFKDVNIKKEYVFIILTFALFAILKNVVMIPRDFDFLSFVIPLCSLIFFIFLFFYVVLSFSRFVVSTIERLYYYFEDFAIKSGYVSSYFGFIIHRVFVLLINMLPYVFVPLARTGVISGEFEDLFPIEALFWYFLYQIGPEITNHLDIALKPHYSKIRGIIVSKYNSMKSTLLNKLKPYLDKIRDMTSPKSFDKVRTEGDTIPYPQHHFHNSFHLFEFDLIDKKNLKRLEYLAYAVMASLLMTFLVSYIRSCQNCVSLDSFIDIFPSNKIIPEVFNNRFLTNQNSINQNLIGEHTQT